MVNTGRLKVFMQQNNNNNQPAALSSGKKTGAQGDNARPRSGAEKSGVLRLLVVSGLIMFGFYLYYLYNAWLTIAASAGLFFALNYYINLKELESGEDYRKIMTKFFIFAGIALICVRFYKALTFPADLSGDDWNFFVEDFYKLRGERSFFDFSRRDAANLAYTTEAIYSLVFKLINYRFDLVYLIPKAEMILGAAGMYLLGKRLKGKNFGAILFFLYTAFGWTIYTSRQFGVCMNVPVFLIYMLLCFFNYTKSRNAWWLAGAAAIYTLGLFTYATWVLTIALLFYLTFEYAGEMDKKHRNIFLVYLVVILAAPVYFYIKNKSAVQWAVSQSVLNHGNIILKVLSSIKLFPEFLILPYPKSQYFTETLPLLSYPEYMMFSGAVLKTFRYISTPFA